MPMPPPERHGGNLATTAERLGCRPSQLLDASASLVPFGPPWAVRWQLLRAAFGAQARVYPDRDYTALRAALAGFHGLSPDSVLPGNGAAELFTWAARDAAAAGVSVLPQPGFADYPRALACWAGAWRAMPLSLQPAVQPAVQPQQFPAPPAAEVLWITNPHNPTGQLWSRASLEPLLERFALVIVDEAFLPLVPAGEDQSLIPLVAAQPNLVVIRSLTKLYGIAGLRLGYAVAQPQRLRRWGCWRDPWPVNGLAAAVGEGLLGNPAACRRWRQCHLSTMPPNMQPSLDPVVEVPTVWLGFSACQRFARILRQRSSSSAVWGYSSLSIMFFSAHSCISSSASGSIQVPTKVARLSRALPSSIR